MLLQHTLEHGQSRVVAAEAIEASDEQDLVAAGLRSLDELIAEADRSDADAERFGTE